MDELICITCIWFGFSSVLIETEKHRQKLCKMVTVGVMRSWKVIHFPAKHFQALSSVREFCFHVEQI